jgi:hypothetical protein
MPANEYCAIICGLNVIAAIPLDTGVLFWDVSGHRCIVTPAEIDGERLDISELAGADNIEWVLSSEFFSECSLGCPTARQSLDGMTTCVYACIHENQAGGRRRTGKDSQKLTQPY